MRAVYGRLRVYEIRHFGAPVGRKPFFHGGSPVSKKERARIGNRTERGVAHDRHAGSDGHSFVLKMLGKREKRDGYGQCGDGSF